MAGRRGNRKRPYEKEEVAKWMGDLRRFLIEDGTTKSFSTFKYLKVVPSLLKQDLPTHSRAASDCDDLPEMTGYVVCDNCRSLFVSSGGHLHLVLIDDRRGKWELKCFPLAFRKSGGKSADQVRKDFEKTFADLAIDMDLDTTLLVADGAMRSVVTDTYLLGYLRCINHSINLLCKHTLSPYEADKYLFTADELLNLGEINALVKSCVSICNLIHFDKKLSDVLSRKPRKAVVTRWLTEFSSVCDVLDVLDEVFAITSQNKKSVITPLVEKVICNRSVLRALQLVLWHMAACNKKFHERTLLLHTVCYVYKKLGNLFEDYASGRFTLIPEEFEDNWQYDDDAAKLLGKAAKFSLNRLYEEFGGFHLAAARLDYAKKDMKLFTRTEKHKADSCLLDLMELVEHDRVPTSNFPEPIQ